MILRASLYLNALLLIACIVLGGIWRYEVGRKNAILFAEGKAQLAASEAARKHEKELSDANAAAGEQYEKGRRDAEANGKRVADDLRAGNVRLRRMWRGCEANSVPGTPQGVAKPDDPTEGRAGSAGRIIGAADDDAAKIRALQKHAKDIEDILNAGRK